MLQTEIAALVCNAAGYYLYVHGHYQKAEPLYTRALEIWKQELGPGHPNTTTIVIRRQFYLGGKYPTK